MIIHYYNLFLSALICICCVSFGCKEKDAAPESKYKEMLGNYQDFDDDTVRLMVREYLKAEHEKLDWLTPDAKLQLNEHGASELNEADIESIGSEYRVVTTVNTRATPSVTSAWIVGRSGLVEEVNLHTLTKAYKGHPVAMSDAEKDVLIRKYLSIISRGHSVAARPGGVIKSLADIPEYNKAPLDPDLESSVRPPYTVNRRIGHEGIESGKIRILYTYRRNGGVVSRYRFQFNKLGSLEEVDGVVLGVDVGAFVYFQ